MKDKRKSYWFAGGFAVFMIALISSMYLSYFPVKTDHSNLVECISDFHNRGNSIKLTPEIVLHDSVTIGNSTYFLLEINGALGSTVLVQNMIGRYKVDRLSYGSGNFNDQIVESEGNKYILYAGKNKALEISSMVFTLEGFTYTLDIPEKSEFLVWKKIDSRIEDVHLDLDTVRLFNAEGKDITEQYDLSGGGI